MNEHISIHHTSIYIHLHPFTSIYIHLHPFTSIYIPVQHHALHHLTHDVPRYVTLQPHGFGRSDPGAEGAHGTGHAGHAGHFQRRHLFATQRNFEGWGIRLIVEFMIHHMITT